MSAGVAVRVAVSGPDAGKVDAFIRGIASKRGEGLFNPWGEISPDEAHPAGGAAARRRRLRQHLVCPGVRLLIIGEAPGYSKLEPPYIRG